MFNDKLFAEHVFDECMNAIMYLQTFLNNLFDFLGDEALNTVVIT